MAGYHGVTKLTHKINHCFSLGFYGKEKQPGRGEGLDRPVGAVEEEKGSTLDKWEKHPEWRVVSASCLCLGSCQAEQTHRVMH